MCGICGFTWRDEGKIQEMVASLRHRGPDAEGIFADDRISLGHARLSVIDLSPAGRQPMASEDGSVILCFNGEIYNFKELRSELRNLGRTFHSDTDTEVILHGYCEWGMGVFRRLNGMWAVGIYDRNRNNLILSRDRLGVKPLYFAHQSGQIIFASEIKAILKHDIPRSLNRAAVDLLLSTQFIPSPMTIFGSVAKVEPRQCVIFDLKTKELSRQYYYDIPRYSPDPDWEKRLAEADDLLEDSVKIRLVADVPVGAFLSGGMDSTVIMSVMRTRLAGDGLHTVSAGFDLPGLDEKPYIDFVRDHYRTVHHGMVFHVNDGEAIADPVSAAYDEPVADPSSFPMYGLCAEARKWMTVALSGDGGDEIFGGYDGRMIVVQFAILAKIPRWIRWGVCRVLDVFCRGRLTPAGRLTEALRVSLLPLEEYHAEIGASFVYRPEAFKAWARSRLRELLPLAGGDLTEAMLKFDIHYNRIGDNYAAKVDRMSMAHALEVRSPFFDYRWVEWASRVPVKWKLTARQTRVLMRELVKNRIPDRILHREKHGFAGPLGAWLDQNRPLMEQMVSSLADQGVIGREWLEFYQSRVLKSPHPIYREYRKRLYFLWLWWLKWGGATVRESGLDGRGAGADSKHCVFQVVGEFGLGGIGRAASDLASALAARGIRVSFVSLKGGLERRPASDCFETVKLQAGHGFFGTVRALRDFRRRVVSSCPEWIHVHGPQSLLFVMLSLVGLLKHRPQVWFTWHDSGEVLGSGGAIRKWLIRRALIRCSRIFGSSGDVAAELQRKLLNKVRVSVFRNGVVDLPQTCGLECREPLIVWAARFVPPKDPLILVRAAARLRDEGLRFRIMMAGKAPDHLQWLEQQVRREVEERGLAERVSMPGWVSDAPSLWGQAAISVQTSHTEGLSMALLESMSAGVAAVATDVGDTRDVVENNVTGLLIPPSDEDALCGALRQLIVDPALRIRFGAAGRERVRADFSLDAMARQVQSLMPS